MIKSILLATVGVAIIAGALLWSVVFGPREFKSRKYEHVSLDQLRDNLIEILSFGRPELRLIIEVGGTRATILVAKLFDAASVSVLAEYCVDGQVVDRERAPVESPETGASLVLRLLERQHEDAAVQKYSYEVWGVGITQRLGWSRPA